MNPEANARTILSTARARAKMHEFRVAPEYYNDLPRDPSILFSLAIGIIGDVTSALADGFTDGVEAAQGSIPLPEYWEESGEDPLGSLQFASIFFDAYVAADLDNELTPELSLLCAAAYYIAGNIGSASVTIRHMETPELSSESGFIFLLYSVLSNKFVQMEEGYAEKTHASAVLNALSGFFSFENDQTKVVEACKEMRKFSRAFGSPREILYSDIIAAVCSLKLADSSRTILPIASGLDAEQWTPALAKPSFPIELWPAQQKISAAGTLLGKSAVIQMPTSAGKTRATELIIRSAFLSNRAKLAVIVAPYRSLCHDIRGDLVNAFSDENILVDEATDSFQFDVTLNNYLETNTILIVTPEKLLYMLRRMPELADQVGLMIYDEGHQFDGISRGPTYELLLTSLKMSLPIETQIILISAVIGNATDLAAWLIGDSEAVVGGDSFLPTQRTIAFASWKFQRGFLEYVNPQDPSEREFFVPRVIAATVLSTTPRENERQFPERTGRTAGTDIALFLGLHVVTNGSVAIFCGTKASVTKICKRVIELVKRDFEPSWPLEVSDPDEVEKIRSLIEIELGPSAPATIAASYGIFAHHADTPRGIRLAIEHAMKLGLTKFVVCTSTLAQGVNFPLKYLIVSTTQQGGEQIMVRDFQNLMGRAGRAGMHTEGSVIFSSPTIYDQQNKFGNGQRNWRAATKILDAKNTEPSSSAILSVFAPYRQRIPAVTLEIKPEWLNLAFAKADQIAVIVTAAAFDQPDLIQREFQRFIEGRARVIQNVAAFLVANMTFAEEEDTSERIQELAKNTLAYALADDETKVKLIDVFRSIAQSIDDNTDGDQRTLIRRSPLPPAAVSDIRDWMVENLELLEKAVEEKQLIEVVIPLVLKFVTSKNIRAITVQNVIPRTLLEWVGGQTFAVMHQTLIDAGARVGGNFLHPTEEHTVALCENGFGYDAAMVMASITDLAEEVSGPLHAAAALLQRQIKCGLTEIPSLTFYEAGFANRYIANYLGMLWPNVVDRSTVRQLCQQEETMRDVLGHFPSYFTAVAAELGDWA